MPKRAHHIAARQAQLAGRSRKKRQGHTRPAEAPPQPVQPASGEEAGATTAVSAALPAQPDGAPGAPTIAPKGARPSLSSVQASQPAPKLTVAEARFFSDQRYFIHDLTRIGVFTGLIAVTFIVLFFFLG